ncbi:metalloregulator ArsR/SmtB family transcription factor [Luteimicrobium sp. DT211]|uniref:metalloregulator ArsR/SmtB family transcription factor n=1 Tax=Luteimicrobium sp. DT211 TaxID=3393412 RepID=UPI003CF9EF42
MAGMREEPPVTTRRVLEAGAIGGQAARHLAEILAALADPVRLRMLSLIGTVDEVGVRDLAALSDLAQPTVSHHLRVLRDAGLVSSQRRGNRVWYRIARGRGPTVGTLFDILAPIALDPPRTPRPGRPEDIEDALDRLTGRLAAAYPEASFDVVRRMVRECATGLVRSRTTAGAVPLLVLVERFARQRLSDASRDRADAAPHVLFVSQTDTARSQLAAALTRRLSQHRIVVRTAGLTPGAQIPRNVRTLLTELEIPEAAAFPKALTDDALRAADVVVTLGCADACPVLPHVRYEDWPVGDPTFASPVGFAALRDELQDRAARLVAQLDDEHAVAPPPE